MMKIAKKVIWIVLVLLIGIVFCSCNTIRGVGKDIEGAGEVIQDAAKKTQQAIKFSLS